MKQILIMLLLAGVCYSQKTNIEIVKQSGKEYYWGEGSANTVKEAERAALTQVTESIAVKITSLFKRKVSEGGNGLNDNVERVMETYSGATLKNVNFIREKKSSGYYVFCYISRNEVDKIFEERKKLLKDLALKADEFYNDNSYGYALKYNFYALLLMNSIPEQNIYSGDINLTTEIPSRINKIISDVRFSVVYDKKRGGQEREIGLRVTSQKGDIRNLEITFWTGNNEAEAMVSDGFVSFDLFGASTQFHKLDINVKYVYTYCKDEIKEVGELWDLVDHPIFKAEKTIRFDEKKAGTAAPETEPVQSSASGKIANSVYSVELASGGDCPEKIKSKIQKNSVKLIDVLGDKPVITLGDAVLNDPFLISKVSNLKKYNKLKLPDFTNTPSLNQVFSGWEMRSFPVRNTYRTLGKQIMENLVLDFDTSGKSYDINFGLPVSLYRDFKEQSKYTGDWDKRHVIIRFLEKYRTSFMTRDLEAIDKMFAEKAVIIVGRILKDNSLKDVRKLYEQIPDVEYIRMTKDQYIEKQRRLFALREDIHLGFSTLKITRKNKQDGVYGISMRQHYNSTGYADEGFLFLLVDFNHELPQIYVRSWQPQEWDEKELIRLSNFTLYD